MRNPECDDLVGNYKIGGKKLTLYTIAKHFYFASIVPVGMPYYNSEQISGKCFATAEVVKRFYGGDAVHAFVCTLDEEGKDLQLMPHGIVIKDSIIIDPLNNHIHPDESIPYLLPKKIKKAETLLSIDYISLTKEQLYSIFPRDYREVL